MPRPSPPPVRTLLTSPLLEQSDIVANCRMNRERRLTGTNSYQKELGFNPENLLSERIIFQGGARWLDLCCGSGTALIEMAERCQRAGVERKVEIIGVDLAGLFATPKTKLNCLKLVESSLTKYRPKGQFDLITCVHGLHYIGDKLQLITRAVSWLNDDGKFIAHLDPHNLKQSNGRPASRVIIAELRRQQVRYETRHKRLVIEGTKQLDLPFRYLGADDQAGPNYTKQPAVDSYYELL